MSKLEKLQCDNCGGKIDGVTLLCQSCGMQYRLKDESGQLSLVRIETSDIKFNTYGVAVSIPDFYIKEDINSAMELGLTELARELAKKILPLIEYRATYDIRRNEYNLFGRLRVAEPHEQDKNIIKNRG